MEIIWKWSWKSKKKYILDCTFQEKIIVFPFGLKKEAKLSSTELHFSVSCLRLPGEDFRCHLFNSTLWVLTFSVCC